MLLTFSFIKTEKTRKNVASLVRYVTAKARTKEGQARNAICIHEMVRLPLELDLHQAKAPAATRRWMEGKGKEL